MAIRTEKLNKAQNKRSENNNASSQTDRFTVQTNAPLERMGVQYTCKHDE